MKNKALLAWSGGKDSALALFELSRSQSVDVVALLTTVTEGYERISIDGVRRDLLVEQARALGYPLEEVRIPQQCTNEIYEERVRQALEKYREAGAEQTAFGDLFLEDIRAYREERLGQIGMRAVFPLWGRNTADLAREFVQWGFRAIVVCVDTQALDAAYAGREYDGPVFRRPIHVERGEVVMRESRFCYCDLAVAGS